jgi:hypothetical protein
MEACTKKTGKRDVLMTVPWGPEEWHDAATQVKGASFAGILSGAAVAAVEYCSLSITSKVPSRLVVVGCSDLDSG